MTRHEETRLFPYAQGPVFDMVADVENYPKFLPWTLGARILKRDNDAAFTAELLVGFRMIRERYTSRVTLVRPDRIDVSYVDGPFRRLSNVWRFAPVDEGTRVDFELEFEFRSRVLQNLMGALFHEAVRRMVAAFEARARKLYGPPPANSNFAAAGRTA